MRIGLAEFVIPLADFDAEVEQLVRRITDNSTFSHAANKRLLEATDNDALDAGLAGEVMENEGAGQDMRERIRATAQGRGQRDRRRQCGSLPDRAGAAAAASR